VQLLLYSIDEWHCDLPTLKATVFVDLREAAFLRFVITSFKAKDGTDGGNVVDSDREDGISSDDDSDDVGGTQVWDTVALHERNAAFPPDFFALPKWMENCSESETDDDNTKTAGGDDKGGRKVEL
jgi:hypothetical protein